MKNTTCWMQIKVLILNYQQQNVSPPTALHSLHFNYQSSQLHGSASTLRGHEVRPDWRQRLMSGHDCLPCCSWLEADLELNVRLCNNLRRSQGYIKDQTARLDLRRESLANLQSSSFQCQLLLKSEPPRSIQSPAWQITFMLLYQWRCPNVPASVIHKGLVFGNSSDKPLAKSTV